MHTPCLLMMIGLTCSPLFVQTTNRLAPGAPGRDAHWPSAAKNGFGTANSTDSKVWFTLNNGVMTEVFYPTLDVPNTQTLQFIVCRKGQCSTESDDMSHALQILDPLSLSFRQINRARSGAFTLSKTYTTDVERSTVLIDVQFASTSNTSYTLYVHYDPSLNNSGMHDTSWSDSQSLLASDGNISSALISSSGFQQMTSGFLGVSDGFDDLKSEGHLRELFQRAEKGNVVQLAKLGNARRFTIALGFDANTGEALANAQLSLKKGFAQAQREYDAGWQAYVVSLRNVPVRYRPQYNMAAMVLKGLEDKTHRGAMIASPSNPWGAGANANEPTTTGYHAVWSRDLYHVATAFLAMGDRASAERALDYLFQTQQRPDGSFPQNSRVDGRQIGSALQMDEIAFPILLAQQLGRTQRSTWIKHIKPAADFILRRGPATEQERWEEESGYSPSTIAAEIAALVCAADIGTRNGDQTSSEAYLKRADEWTKNVEYWTATSSGPYKSIYKASEQVHNKSAYFIRITENDNPNDAVKLELNSRGGTYNENEILDAGFLELVRLGIMRADDPLILRSLEMIDRVIKVETPHGAAWYRYNHDAYGERPDGGRYDGRGGKGRPWPLLTGERGQYELAWGKTSAARRRLEALMGFANDGRMIPEQIWDRPVSPRRELRFGEGTGSATPLAWSMAQFVRLVINVQDGRNLETPAAVSFRYQPRRSNGHVNR